MLYNKASAFFIWLNFIYDSVSFVGLCWICMYLCMLACMRICVCTRVHDGNALYIMCSCR